MIRLDILACVAGGGFALPLYEQIVLKARELGLAGALNHKGH